MKSNSIPGFSPVKPYGDAHKSKKEEVEEMFNNISGKYDFLNHFLSMGIDRGWRKTAIAQLRDIAPRHLLDIATGTGELAIASMAVKPGKVTGIDISDGMLEVGRKKIKQLGLDGTIELVNADSENIPYPGNTFDAAIVGFGVRNFENLDKGLKEINRVLKPGAKFVVLEFSKPSAFPVKQLFGFYSRYILPVLGKMISKDASAYSYLPESVKVFPYGKQFLERLHMAGFHQTTVKPLTFGIASVYTGIKK